MAQIQQQIANHRTIGKATNIQATTPLKILFVTSPVTGHVNPALPLAMELVKRGHDVHWYTSTRFQSKIEATGAQFHAFQIAVDIDFTQDLNDLFPERAQLKGLSQDKWDLRMILDTGIDQMKDLADIHQIVSPDLILADMMAFSALFFAEKMKIPIALLNVSNLFVMSLDTAPTGLALAPNASAIGRVRNRLLNWLVQKVFFRDINAYLRAIRTQLGLPMNTETFFEFPFNRSDLFLQTTIPSFEYPCSDLPNHIHFIGALIPDPPIVFNRPAWWHELEGDRPVVLATQGTIATNPEELLIPTIRGLANEDVLVIATAGRHMNDLTSFHPLPDNVRLESFIPFNHLMPYIDVMITNGGYGGTHFALTYGVPLVAAGESEDKSEICARIAWSGVGINLKTQTPNPAQIKKAVKTVLSDAQYKMKAKAMRATFAQFDAPTIASDLLEKLATEKLPVSYGESHA